MIGEDVKLGDIIKDSITGFQGVAVAKTQWLNGCWRVTIQPQELRDGKPVENQTFDVEQLELVEAKGVDQKPWWRRTGGPNPDPVRPSGPTR